MDRRQKRTRNLIFSAFLKLLSTREFSTISVQDIIDEADIGRATFYAHFETKDYLLKSLCEDLFSHIEVAASGKKDDNGNYNSCTENSDIFTHLMHHLLNNDNYILKLLVSPNNALFLRYFKSSLYNAVEQKLNNTTSLPKDFLINHISSVFVETVLWWVNNGKKETPETLSEYLSLVLGDCFK